MKDYYAILGIASSAEEIVIRAAWKALAQRYHPDRFDGDAEQAHARMSEINEAYNILSDPVKRKRYDEVWARNKATVQEEDAGQATTSTGQFERDWALAVGAQPNFGNKPEIIAFARQLMFEGNKDAAKALNDSIRELSSDVPADWIINKICEEFNIETKEMWKRRLQREAKAREDAVWRKVREKAKVEMADADVVGTPEFKPEPAPEPAPEAVLPSKIRIRPNWNWQGSFLSAAVIVVLFVVVVIWLFK